MDRVVLAERMRRLGLELRDSADVVPIDETVTLPLGQVLVEHLVHDAGLLLLLWRSGGDPNPELWVGAHHNEV